MLRRLASAALIAACVTTLLTSAAVAAKPGNSPNAKLCQKGGWQSLYTSSFESFASEAACVAYAAQGGVFQRSAGADVSLTYNAATDAIDVTNSGPQATSLTIEIDTSANVGNAIGPTAQGAPDGWTCIPATVLLCSTPSLAAGATVSFDTGTFPRTGVFPYEVVAAGVTDPDSTPDNGVLTEDDIASLPVSPT